MADIDYEVAYGIACAELFKAKSEIERLRAALAEIAALKGEDLYVADGCSFDNLAAMKASAAIATNSADRE